MDGVGRLHDAVDVYPLTGIHNRAHFIRRFEELKAGAPGPAMLGMLDIDNFKAINDRLGHAGGDDVLREVARRLATAVRGVDLVARWSGEEFILLAPGIADATRAGDMANRLLDALRNAPIQAGGTSLRVTASMGHGLVRLAPGTDLDREVGRVDEYLYVAKRSGRNRAVGAPS